MVPVRKGNDIFLGKQLEDNAIQIAQVWENIGA